MKSHEKATKEKSLESLKDKDSRLISIVFIFELFRQYSQDEVIFSQK